MNKWLSRKLFVTAGSVVTAVLVNVGLPEDVASKVTETIVYIAGAYLLGQGAADAAKEMKRA